MWDKRSFFSFFFDEESESGKEEEGDRREGKGMSIIESKQNHKENGVKNKKSGIVGVLNVAWGL